MPQWEYRMEESPPGAPDETGPVWLRRLQGAGAEGWELVAEHLHQFTDGRVRYSGTLKRPVAEGAPAPASAHSSAPPTFSPPVADVPATDVDRLEVLRGLVFSGVLTEADAADLAPGGKVSDSAWAIVQSLQSAEPPGG